MPLMVRQRFQNHPAALKEPILEEFPGAVAFVDISGFTKLSMRLAAEHGERGAEFLNKYVSQYFERLINVIVQHGGE